MELRPGYKSTDIGLVPEDWLVVTLESITDPRAPIRYGVVQIGSNTPNGVPIVPIKFIKAISTAQLPRSARSIEERFAGSRIIAGDVLISVKGTIGRVGIVPSLFKGNIAREIARLRIKGEEIPQFIMHQLEGDHTQRRIADAVVGTTRLEFSIAAVREFAIALPPSQAERKAIAEALSDVDASIAALSRLIAKKRDLRQGAMQRLLTGQTRLPGFTAPWQERRLGEHVAFLKNGIQSRAQLTLNDPVRYLHYGDIHVSADLCLDLSNTRIPRLPSSAAAGLTRLQNGDLVFVDASEDLNGVGKSLEIVGATGVEAVSGQHTIAARFDKFVLADGFKRYLQFIPAFTTHLRRLAAGTKVYATNRKHIASAELRLPETDEQIAIARVLSDMELEISTLETRLDKTHALKQAMMQALLTGRVRLPVRRDVAVQTMEAAHA